MTILTAADATRRLLVARQGRVLIDEPGGDTRLSDDLVRTTLLDYFAHGSRPSMHGVAMLHVAARCTPVVIRDEGFGEYRRQDNESARTFFGRLRDGSPDAMHATLPRSDSPLLAALFRGDVAVPPGSEVYAVFREQLIPTMAASDFVVGEPPS